MQFHFIKRWDGYYVQVRGQQGLISLSLSVFKKTVQ